MDVDMEPRGFRCLSQSGVDDTFGGVDPTDGLFQAFFGPVSSTGGITQTLATTPGASYDLTFDLHNFGGTPNFFSVAFGGTTLYSFTDGGAFPYTSLTFDVSATSASTDLTFTFQQSPSFMLLDNVSVAQVNAVPEPASMLLLGTGLAGLAARARRRTKTRA